MTRAAVQYVFAAVLALLTTQVVVPPARVVSVVEIVCSVRTKQHAPRKTRDIQVRERVLNSAPVYQSWRGTEPHTPALFQRPPPPIFLFS